MLEPEPEPDWPADEQWGGSVSLTSLAGTPILVPFPIVPT